MGTLFAVAAAVLYGVSFPASKYIQDSGVHPFIQGGLSYMAQGIVFFAWRTAFGAKPEHRLAGSDWKWLGWAALLGGVLAPPVYLYGQMVVTAHGAALLAPTEVLFTTVVAVFVFRERLSAKEAAAMGVIVVGAALVGFEPGGVLVAWGPALVVISYFLWAIDNNLTTRIAGKDPIQIAAMKGFIGGAANLGVGLALGQPIPTDPSTIGWIAAVGAACFGGSFAMIVVSMRHLGAARATAIFGTAPAFAVVASWLALGEVPAALKIAGGIVAGAGVAWLIVSRRDSL